MRRVGIMGGTSGGGPLYCYVEKDSFGVINGDWKLGFDGLIYDGRNKNYIDYEIVLEDMDNMDYNDACRLIEDAYEKLPKDRVKNDRGKFVANLLKEYKAFTVKHIDGIDNKLLFLLAHEYDLLITNRPTRLFEDIKDELIKSDILAVHREIKKLVEYDPDDEIAF